MHQMKLYWGIKEKNQSVAKYVLRVLYYSVLPGQQVDKYLLLEFCIKEPSSVHIFPQYFFFTHPNHGFLPTEENLRIHEKNRLLKKIAGLCTIFVFEIFLWLLKVKAMKTETNLNLTSLMQEWSSINKTLVLLMNFGVNMKVQFSKPKFSEYSWVCTISGIAYLRN